MLKEKTFISCFFILLFSHALLAQDACDGIVQSAIETASEHCAGLRRNQACYGNTLIDAEAAADVEDFSFATAGDMVNIADIASMRLSSNLENGDWGISLMQARASLEEDVQESIIILLFGNLAVENSVTTYTIELVANANTRLRHSPDSTTDLNIIEAVAAGSQMTAFGRNESGEWLRVRMSGITGWITALNVNGDSERMSLPIVEFSAPFMGPMQGFYLTNVNADSSDCASLPPDGLIIQTPEGAGTIDFIINEVRISIGSTAYIGLDNNSLSIVLLEGLGTVAALGTERFVPAKTQTIVALSEDGRSPSSPPSGVSIYDAEALQNLNSLLSQLMPVPVAIETIEPDLAIEDYVEEMRGTIQIADGIWYMTLETVLTVEDSLISQQGISGCTLNAQAGTAIARRFPYDAANNTFDTRPLLSPGVYGDSESGHASVLAPHDEIELGLHAQTFTLNSATSFTYRYSFRNHWIGGGTGEAYKIACIQNWRGTWVGSS